MSDSYEMLDRYLWNNLSDDDYAEYSDALNDLNAPSAMLQIQIETLRQRVKDLEDKESAEFFDAKRIIKMQREELSALKQSQGEPVAWYWMDWTTRYVTTCHPSAWDTPCETLNYGPLYASSQTIPEGWQLVPIEPTPGMLDSCDEVQIWKTWDGGRFYMDWGMAESAYKAMLAAAPKPEEVK